jgi:5-methyltetrahydrofolate--homocysteine methyltransferase
MGILDRLSRGSVLVADGAMGTMLQSSGVEIGTPPERWLLDHPDAVQAIHRAYQEAGSELVLTCTFGATRLRLTASGLGDRVEEINRQAVRVARHAVSGGTFVAGDIGPLGQLLDPLGDITFDQAVGIFAEQASVLVDAGVDVLYVETMSDLNEASAAVQAALQVGSGTPVFATMSFDSHGRTSMGVRPEDAARDLCGLGVAAVGANCGATLDMTENALMLMHEAVPGVPLIAKPNAGRPRVVGQHVQYDATPMDMGERAVRFAAIGARVVGACCGSTPEHIGAIAQALRAV